MLRPRDASTKELGRFEDQRATGYWLLVGLPAGVVVGGRIMMLRYNRGWHVAVGGQEGSNLRYCYLVALPAVSIGPFVLESNRLKHRGVDVEHKIWA
jgi:hypothetical protein